MRGDELVMVCSCSSPVCQLFGCQQAAQIRQQYARPPACTPPAFHPLNPAPLTPEDIRRIVREEIERASKERPE